MSSNIKIQKRDFLILQQITKYRFLLSRQIKILAGFAGQRSCDRRLKKLIDNGFIQRKYFIYGISGLYFATGKAKKITVFTYKAKKNEKRKMGHRQPYTKVQIESINA